MKQRTILFVVTEDWYFLSHRKQLARELRDLGAKVHVATNPGQDVQMIKSEGFTHHQVHFERGSINPINDLRTTFQLRKIYSELTPDIVHHVAIKPVVLGSLACAKMNKIRVVNAITGLGYAFTEHNTKARIARNAICCALRFALRRVKYNMIFQNPDDQKAFVENGIVSENLSHIIYGSGVDIEKYRPTHPTTINKPLKFLFPARMLWNKGIKELIEATAILKNQGFQFELILAGRIDEGNPTSVKLETIREWQALGLAKWVGHRTDLDSLLHTVDAVILPSYREGSPLSLIEAAACGKPIITTNVTGCREVVTDNYNGILVQPKDINALANAISKLINSPPELLNFFGKNSRLIAVEKFDQNKIIAQTVGIYKNILTDT